VKETNIKDKTMNEINLRPYREKEEKKINKNFKISIIVSIIVSVIFIGHQYNEHNKTLSNYEDRAVSINENLDFITNYNEANKNIENEKRMNLEKLKVSYSLYKGKLNTAMILDELVEVFPSDNGKINKLFKNKNKIVINGVLNNEESFHKFLKNMAISKTLSNYTVSEINNLQDSVSFKVQVFENANKRNEIK
jgi:Tfp pilus assembly protein PilN